MTSKRRILLITSLFLVIFPCFTYAMDDSILGDLSDQEKALFQAAIENDVQTIEKLADEGVNLDVKNTLGETPLHEAARSDSTEAIKTLYNLGAYIEEQNNQWETPKDIAKYSGNWDAFSTLEELVIQWNIDSGVFPEDHCF